MRAHARRERCAHRRPAAGGATPGAVRIAPGAGKAWAKKWVHRRKPWSLGERLRNLTPDFMDVRRRNCSIARHFRH
ncbi:hypothetical protein PMC2000_26045 [Burkholderia pseudomallei]|nr:hypothetical protein BHT10_33715 [Burkholderia pseudomallei]MUU85184.1 hypothetical protein [Burkholderia pseudomallei]QGS81957.1 hypothetical protein PMC2000_26045 [Burkholderia pseudomallei]QGS95245.1 hypothetical protein R15_26550 [Burkholderia pseudomallei]QGT07643.1 hypothetical protein D286_25900 [Burkholderia pseudomallei]